MDALGEPLQIRLRLAKASHQPVDFGVEVFELEAADVARSRRGFSRACRASRTAPVSARGHSLMLPRPLDSAGHLCADSSRCGQDECKGHSDSKERIDSGLRRGVSPAPARRAGAAVLAASVKVTSKTGSREAMSSAHRVETR